MQEDTPVPEAASPQTGMLRNQSASRILSDCFCAAEFCCVSQAWREKQLPHSKCLRQLAILSSCKSGSTGAACISGEPSPALNSLLWCRKPKTRKRGQQTATQQRRKILKFDKVGYAPSALAISGQCWCCCNYPDAVLLWNMKPIRRSATWLHPLLISYVL